MKGLLLTITLIFAVFLAPLTMRAATAIDLAETINGFSSISGGSGSTLTATVDGNTVTVTGTLTGVTTGLSLDIDEGITVEWKAEISTGSSFMGNTLISLTGAGTFDVTTGGSVTTTNEAVSAIISSNATLITVSGTGLVQVTGNTYCAIFTFGCVEVSGGEVSSTTGYAIYAWGESSTVTVTGGTITSGGYEVIFISNSDNTGLNVTVSGTGIVQTTSGVAGIFTYGNVEVKDNAQVSSASGSAIEALGESSTVTVTGGIVTSGGNPVISVGSNDNTNLNVTVTISGTGKVQGTGYLNGRAIVSFGSVEIKDNAEVSSVSGSAIEVWGESSTVTVSGGTVTGGGNPVINVVNSDNNGLNVIVSGTGIVQTTNDNTIAIVTYGSVEVKDNAQVKAIAATAVEARSGSSLVTVSGGTVSSDGGRQVINVYDEKSTSVSYTGLNVIVSGGIVQATGENNRGIAAGGDVEVSGGVVSSTTDAAIEAWGENSKVTVSASTVESGGYQGIFISNSNNTEPNVTISGTAIVHVTGQWSRAIQTSGSVVISGGEVSSDTGSTIEVTGENSTVTVNGGTVKSGGYQVIYVSNSNNTGTNVTVGGTGTIQASSADYGVGIDTPGNVEVSAGTVSTDTGAAIRATGANSKVTVSGTAIVEATGDGTAIAATGDAVDVEVNGGEVRSTTHDAIYTSGNVEINGGKIISTSGVAISVGSTSPTTTVTVSDGTIIGGGTNAITVWNGNPTSSDIGMNVIVSGGTIQATSTGTAIATGGNVKVSGGEISATANDAINTPGNVEITGGEVTISAPGVSAISAWSESSKVVVGGTSKVEATGGGTGIYTMGSVEVKDDAQVSAPAGTAINADNENSVVTVSGGTVSASIGAAIYTNGSVVVTGGKVFTTSVCAINAYNENSTVIVSGGVVFAYGDAINGQVIYTANPDGFTGATGEGVVIAWNQAADKTYTQGSSEDIILSPESATAVWDKNGSEYGITYTNGANTGFIPLEVSVVSTVCDIASIESPADAAIADLMITANVANNITSQVVELTTSDGASWKLFSDVDCTNEITDKTMTLAVGDNTAYIQVTAEDGTTTKVYTLVVNRAEAEYGITVASNGNGEVSADTYSATEGTVVTLTITSDPNYELNALSVYKTGDAATGVTLTGTGDTRTFTMPGFDVTVAASFIETPYFDVSPSELTFSASGEKKTLDVTSNLYWEAVSDVDWITLTPASGSDNGTITVTVDSNPETTQRTATITINASGYTETIGVTQAGALVIPVSSVALNQTAAELPVDSILQLTATVLPLDATNSNVTWSTGDATVATVSDNGLVTAVGEGTATITVTTADGGFTATCTVTVIRQEVVVDEGTQVGADGKGKIVLSLTIPVDVLFSGSFSLTLPDGMQLDLDSTRLAGNLASLLTLSIVQNADGSWLFTIEPQALRSAAANSDYTKIVEIGYTADKTVANGTYEALINDLSFEFDNGVTVAESKMPVSITVDNSSTGIRKTNGETDAYLYKSKLYVTGPIAETIHVYSVNGVMLYNFQKPAGSVVYPINARPGTVLIVKGSSGWEKKMIGN